MTAGQVIAWLGLVCAAFALGLAVGMAIARAPLCTCADVDCGGGCIDWERASG